MNEKVHIAAYPVDYELFYQILHELGLKGKIKNSKKIIIKPNLAAGHSFNAKSGVVTSLELIDTLINYINKIHANCNIYIVESDSTYHGYCYDKYIFNNYYSLEQKYSNVTLIDLTRDKHKLIPLNGLYFKQFDLPLTLEYYDFFITVAKMKTNTNTVVTGALKNQFGCIPDMEKMNYHPYLSKIIVDLNTLLKPDLCIIETNPAMEGAGPVFGQKVNTNLLLLGNNPVATDAVMSEIMGFNPKKIRHIKFAHKQGLGPIELKEIEISGKKISDAKIKFKFIPFQQKIFVVLGFLIQKFGLGIAHFGNELHFRQSVFEFIKITIKSVAIKVIKKVLRKI